MSDPAREGRKTSEFWMLVAIMAFQAAMVILTALSAFGELVVRTEVPLIASIVMFGGIAIAYIIGRAIVKYAQLRFGK